MNYLLDKKIKRKKVAKIALGAVLLVVLFYFRLGIFEIASYVSQRVFHPVLILGNNLSGKLKSAGAYFVSKSSLYSQNQDLQSKLNEQDAQISNYNSLLAEDESLKEILGRKNANGIMTLAAILAKPNQSPYDTLVIDAGEKENVKMDDTVFALGDVPIGYIAAAYPDSAKVILFSNAGERTEGMIYGKNIFTELVGRGGENFEMVMPKDLTLQKGDQVVMPGITPYLLATVQTIISDPRDPFTKALLTSPVNVQELNFVEVEQ